MQSFVISLQTIPLLLFVALLGMVAAYAAITLFDKRLWPTLDFAKALAKDNRAVGMVVAAIIFGVFYLVAQAVA